MLRRLPAVYLATTVVVAVARAVSGHPSASALALTPDRLHAGKLWLFASSAVIVNGAALPQLAAVVATLGETTRRFGARFAGGLMITAHVGATLLAYAALEVFTGDADGAHNHDLDYGVSAVGMGALGALTVAALRLPHGLRAAALTGSIAALAVSVAAFPLLAATEHGLAYAIGVVVALREVRRAAGRSARSGAATAS